MRVPCSYSYILCSTKVENEKLFESNILNGKRAKKLSKTIRDYLQANYKQINHKTDLTKFINFESTGDFIEYYAECEERSIIKARTIKRENPIIDLVAKDITSNDGAGEFGFVFTYNKEKLQLIESIAVNIPGMDVIIDDIKQSLRGSTKNWFISDYGSWFTQGDA